MSETDLGELIRRLHHLDGSLQTVKQWVEGPHLTPISEVHRQGILQSVDDVQSRLNHWKSEPTLLTVVFLGGTGVGKSTLLNALAGEAIASAGLMRPTTQTPTVYHHRDVSLDRLDARLHKCRAVAHNRSELRHKILVDTPDIDGSVVEHHDRLHEILPLADCVVYVGSQEKYHDREGWRLLMEHRRARGFAFVLNKWDRCQAHSGDREGRSPDEDFRKSLRAAGFDDPLLFRTVASQWALERIHGQKPDETIDDDFLRLEAWLENGLHEGAVRAIKLSGISSGLSQLVELLKKVIPPDFSRKSNDLIAEWNTVLRDSVNELATSIIHSGDRHAYLFDTHFRQLDRRDYGGLFGWYLTIADLLSRVQWSLRPSLPSSPTDLLQPSAGALGDWVRRTINETPRIVRDDQARDISRRLLAAADRSGWPVYALEHEMPQAHEGDSTSLLGKILSEESESLEREIRSPGGTQHAMRTGFRFLAHWLPWIVFVGIVGYWILSVLFWGGALVTLTPISLALIMTLLSLMGLHFVLSRFLPTQWKQLRGRFARGLEQRLHQTIAPPYFASLDRFVKASHAERSVIQKPKREIIAVRDGLEQMKFDTGGEQMFARSSS